MRKPPFFFTPSLSKAWVYVEFAAVGGRDCMLSSAYCTVGSHMLHLAKLWQPISLARAVSRGMRLQMHLYRGTKALPLELPLEPARAVKREEVVDPSCPLRQQMRTDKVHVLLSV